ncbi:MAG: TSUP family transporter [Pseudomonadota bacterium]
MTSALLLLAVFLTAALSAVFGMAGGLVLMGLLALLFPVPVAMVTHGLVQSVSNGWRAFLLRDFILWRPLAWYALGALGAVAVLISVSITLPAAWLFIVLGLVPALVWVPADRFRLDFTRRIDAVACGLTVTGLNTIAGVSGPLLDVFAQNAETDRRSIVATKAASQVAAHAVKIVYYVAPALTSGAAPAAWLLVLALGASVLGTSLGARALHRLSEASFRRWTKGLVTVIGATYLARGIWMLSSGGGS